jgi:PadR family transcriptional regulator, regulatory protein PadR
MRGEVLKNHLELLVLTALEAGPGHGYSIIRSTRERSSGEFELLEGSLYPVLHRLERDGLVTSSWSEVGGRRRRVYELRPKGRTALEEQQRNWRRFESAMNAILARSG